MKNYKNILIIGMPQTGKTTLLKKIIEGIPHKTGFLTPEIREQDARIGFDIVTSNGTKKLLADTTKVTPYTVGRYFVQKNAINEIVEEIQNFGEEDILYIDEIGQMELVSTQFQDLIHKYLDAPNRFIGTISQVCESPFIEEIKSRGDVHVYELTSDNGDLLEHLLQK